MITRLEEIPVTKAIRLPVRSVTQSCRSAVMWRKEYYMYGTANVYETADESGGIVCALWMRRIQTAHVSVHCRPCKMQRKRCSGDHQPNEFYGD